MRRVVDFLLMAWEDFVFALGRLRPLWTMLLVQARRTRKFPLSWGTLYVALFCALGMAALDRPVAVYFKGHLSANGEGFFKTVTNLGLAELYMVPAGLLCLGAVVASRRALLPEARKRWQHLAWRPGFLFLAMALSGLLENLMKVCIGRARPRLLFEEGLYGFHPFNHVWAMNSFPSGHSQAAWAAMTALVILVPRYDLLWLLIAVLVAASRVATTVHYLSDAVAGSWIGFAVTVVVARALRKRGIKL